VGEIKKQLMIIGIVILLVVGLSGCIRRGKEVSLSELSAHPSKYYGKEIIVKGAIAEGGVISFNEIFDKNTGVAFYAKLSPDFKDRVNPIFTGEYKFKGIVKQGETFGGNDAYYLEITDAYDPNEIFIPGFEFAILIMAMVGVMMVKKKKNRIIGKR